MNSKTDIDECSIRPWAILPESMIKRQQKALGPTPDQKCISDRFHSLNPISHCDTLMATDSPVSTCFANLTLANVPWQPHATSSANSLHHLDARIAHVDHGNLFIIV